MAKTSLLLFVTFYFITSLSCNAQALIPVIQLSASESADAKQISEKIENAWDREQKAEEAWRDFHDTFQKAHPEIHNLRFTSDYRSAVSLPGQGIGQVPPRASTVELTGDERKRLEALDREFKESSEALRKARRDWDDFTRKFLVNHFPDGNSGSWGSGITLTSDFRFAISRQ